ncbi:MAG: hypothetical protein J6K94_06005 [Ruminiclostridium sp.]|nr:hypothetical protein [Ruminiclostridium sp.]
MEYASKGVAGAGLGLGIAGTSLGLLNGGLGNILGGMGHVCSESTPVNRYELDMSRELANKDMEIAYWRGQDETNRKISDTYANLEGQIKDLAKEVRCNKDEQNGINLQQAVYNGTNTAALNCMQGQIAQLYSLTKLIVPNGSVCPGWGNVTITPEAAAG